MLDDTEDPARLFFPDETDVDLYGVLGLKKDEQPSSDTIKKAYRKLALRYHPDKARLHQGDPEAVALRFQQIGFAYSVLSDEKRRKKYDATGSTSDSIWDSDEPVDWNEYFKTLWTGEVSGKTLEEFKASYQGSDEERRDILQAYRDHKGRLEGIFSEVPCSNILEDEERFMAIINSALQTKEIRPTKAWSALQEPGGSNTRKKLRAKARQEATEAEAYAKELGVWDDLYGTSTKKRKSSPPEPAPTSEPQADDEDVDLDGLRKAMQAKAAQRASSFDAMIERMEQKHAPAVCRPNPCSTSQFTKYKYVTLASTFFSSSHMRFSVLVLLFALVSVVLARIPAGADSSASNMGGPMTRMSDSSSSHAKSTKSSHSKSSSHNSSKSSQSNKQGGGSSSSSSKSSKSATTGGPGDKQTTGTSNTGIPAMTSSSASELASSQLSSALSKHDISPTNGVGGGSQDDSDDSGNGAMGMTPGVLATMLLASTATLLLFIA